MTYRIYYTIRRHFQDESNYPTHSDSEVDMLEAETIEELWTVIDETITYFANQHATEYFSDHQFSSSVKLAFNVDNSEIFEHDKYDAYQEMVFISPILVVNEEDDVPENYSNLYKKVYSAISIEKFLNQNKIDNKIKDKHNKKLIEQEKQLYETLKKKYGDL